MKAIPVDFQCGNEAIMLSQAFVPPSPFVLRDAAPMIVNGRPDTMNIDEIRIKEAITPHIKTMIPKC